MPLRCTLGVDIGTSSSKGVIVSADGVIIATATITHEVLRPRAGICAGWSSLRSTTVRAESSTPRASSVKNGFSMSRVTSAMTSDSCFRSVRAVRWGELQLAGCFAHGERIRIGDATPLKTRDTVAGDTSGSFATS